MVQEHGVGFGMTPGKLRGFWPSEEKIAGAVGRCGMTGCDVAEARGNVIINNIISS